MEPFYKDDLRTLYNGDCRNMEELADESIQCVVTSPPYWGLRKYAGDQELIWGGGISCDHLWGEFIEVGDNRYRPGDHASVALNKNPAVSAGGKMLSQFCSKCGAWKGALGQEPTPEMYVQHTVEILREIRRVLRKDGVVFWNVGESYWGGKGRSSQAWSTRHLNRDTLQKKQHQIADMGETRPSDGKHPILKPKDLCLIPFRVAIAAQEDGWWIRSNIIWNKPNPMPESVRDRPTECHEYIIMMTKSKNYYWDREAVREKYTDPLNRWGGPTLKRETSKTATFKDEVLHLSQSSAMRAGNPIRPNPNGRNIRSIWTFPTRSYLGAHFAVFPEKLPEICIKAAMREGGIVLDTFAGSGTTLKVAALLGHRSVGYELSEEYCRLAVERNKQAAV